MAPRPVRLEYAYAFDSAASWLADVQPPLLGLLSTPEFVDLFLARAPGGVALACENERTRAHAQRRLGELALLRDVAQQSQVLPALDRLAVGAAFGGVMWASPQPATWRTTLATLAPLLTPGTPLCIFASTFWGSLVRPVRATSQPGEPAALARSLRARLVADGWTVSRSRTIGALGGVGWAIVARIAARAGLPHVADRAEQAHHQAIDATFGASYQLLVARRSQPR
jgi:hypothetical protein